MAVDNSPVKAPQPQFPDLTDDYIFSSLLINTDPGPILEFLRVGSGALHLKFLKSWV
jgi:hypothetical protein